MGTLDSKERRTREDRAVAVGGRSRGEEMLEGEGNSSAFMNGREMSGSESERKWRAREKGN